MTPRFLPVVCLAAICMTAGSCASTPNRATARPTISRVQARAKAEAVGPASAAALPGARAARAAWPARPRVRRRRHAGAAAGSGGAASGAGGTGTGGGGGSGGNPTVSRSGMKSAGCGKNLMGATLNMFTNHKISIPACAPCTVPNCPTNCIAPASCPARQRANRGQRRNFLNRDFTIEIPKVMTPLSPRPSSSAPTAADPSRRRRAPVSRFRAKTAPSESVCSRSVPASPTAASGAPPTSRTWASA